MWQDDFNFLNTNIWEVANNFDHYGEPQMYRTNNVSVLSGNLILKVKNESYLGHSYTSGWVETKQAYNTQYGYIEAKIKLPYGYGFWPAFWTWRGNGVPTTNETEIDIFEMLGGGEFGSSNIMTTNIHVNYPDSYFQALSPINYSYTDYHIYGLEWSPSKLIWYLDGIPVRISDNPGITSQARIIFNLAIQNDYLPNYSTPFPSEMLVDYVKVYDLRNDCNTVINTCNYNFSTYNNMVKKEIIIGGNSCVNSIPNNTSQFLRATDGVLINGDFTVPIGSELYIDVNPCY